MDACVLLDVSEILAVGFVVPGLYLSHCFQLRRAETCEPVGLNSRARVQGGALGLPSGWGHMESGQIRQT